MSFNSSQQDGGGDDTSFFSLPWQGDPEEAFFSPFEIDPKRWNKLFPYRLLVVDVSKPNPSILARNPSSVRIENNVLINEGGIEYLITQERQNGTWEMVLPITPQQLQTTDHFAINTSATMRGVVEEHNGVKFKTVTASGTT
ncbi:MAG: hypothetical protein ACTSU6_00960, partial [Candidatus Njordarchaeales archaeon]